MTKRLRNALILFGLAIPAVAFAASKGGSAPSCCPGACCPSCPHCPAGGPAGAGAGATADLPNVR